MNVFKTPRDKALFILNSIKIKFKKELAKDKGSVYIIEKNGAFSIGEQVSVGLASDIQDYIKKLNKELE